VNESITVKLQAVEIERGRETITVEVPAHEVEVLRAVHGPHKVRVTDEHVDDMVLDDSADAEFARLQAKYRRVNTPDFVSAALRGGARDLREFGFSLDRAAREAAPMAGVRNHKKKPEAEKPAKAAKAKDESAK